MIVLITSIKSTVYDQVKEILKDVTSTKGGQWIEKKEMRMCKQKIWSQIQS